MDGEEGNVSINEMGPELLGSAGFSSRKREQVSTSDVVSNRPFGGETVRPSLSRLEKIRQKVGENMPSLPGSRGSNKGNSRGSSRGSSRGGISSGGMLSSGEEDTPDTPDSPDSGGGKIEGSDDREGANILQDCANNDARDGTDAVVDMDINDVIDNDDIDRHELIMNDKLESELDQPPDGDDSDVNADIDELDIGDSIDFATRKEFKEEYVRFHEIGSNPDRFQHLNLPAIMLFIASLVTFVQNTKSNIANYEGKGDELCLLFNKWRIDAGEAMEAALVSTGNGVYKSFINLGSYFYICHVIGIILHYAPIGCRLVLGERFNYMHKDQCCVSVAKKKAPGFLNGEAKDGTTKYAFGGRTEPDNDKSDQIATVDVIPVLCEKGDSDSKMRGHYKTWTDRFGLENFYQLMIIPYCLFQMHILLAQVCHPKKTFQVLVMSSAVALYIFDLGAGIQKYLTRILSKAFEISFVCHPQAWIMGMVRSKTRFPEAVRKYMSENLVRVYRNVFTEWPSNFKTKIMDHFGSKYAGLELGIYSRLARLLDISNLLNLDNDALASINVYARDTIQALTEEQIKAIIEFVKSKLGESGAEWKESHITDFMNELNISHITTVMDRMRKFRSGCKLQSIAAEMRSKVKFFWQLPQHLKTMVDAVASVLGQTRKDVFKSVRNIKKAQKVNGDRLVVLNELASVFNEAGGGDTGIAAVEKEKRKLNKLKSSLVDDSLAIEMIKKSALVQDDGGGRLTLLNELASKYNKAKDDADAVVAVTNDDRFDTLKSLLREGTDDTIVLEMIQDTAAAQIENGGRLGDYNKLVNKLARVFNEKGGVEAGSASIGAVTGDERFNTLKALVGGSEKDAIAAIKKVVKETDATFWRRYKESVRRLNDKNDDSVSKITVKDNGKDVEVLYVKWRKKKGGDIERNSLQDWWAEQVNLPGIVRDRYAVQAWRMKGSLYYLALVELGVSFDERREDDNLNVKAAIAALDARLENADVNRDNAAVDALRGAEFNSNVGLDIEEED